MDKEYVMSVANTILKQLFWSIDKWTYLSWGVSKRVAMVCNDMPTLALRVSGLVHKGWVYISLNEGSDTYEVRLLNVGQDKVKTVLEDIYCDNLGTVIGSLIEKPIGMDDKTYRHKALKDSERKINKVAKP